MSEVKNWNDKIIDEFRANDGKVGGPFEGAPILLLHTKGRKSGEPRVNPLAYQPVGGGYAVFGSMGGAPVDPQWVRNALANGDVEAEIGTDTVKLRAREATGEERERIWTEQKKRMPGFASYEKATEGIRDIPVIVLEPSS
jgi:deazaflavin-dependent oxidoreductase (nitroreductase family)